MTPAGSVPHGAATHAARVSLLLPPEEPLAQGLPRELALLASIIRSVTFGTVHGSASSCSSYSTTDTSASVEPRIFRHMVRALLLASESRNTTTLLGSSDESRKSCALLIWLPNKPTPPVRMASAGPSHTTTVDLDF